MRFYITFTFADKFVILTFNTLMWHFSFAFLLDYRKYIQCQNKKWKIESSAARTPFVSSIIATKVRRAESSVILFLAEAIFS